MMTDMIWGSSLPEMSSTGRRITDCTKSDSIRAMSDAEASPALCGIIIKIYGSDMTIQILKRLNQSEADIYTRS